MKTLRAHITALGFLLLIPALGGAGEIDREPLDQLWQELMLTGVSGEFTGGQRTNFVPTDLPESANGSPGAASLTTRGIAVRDLRGTAVIGLLRGGGWTLSGGLLGQIKQQTGTIELYGKRIWHFYPGLVDNYARFREEETYEFFLLNRAVESQPASLIKKWVIGPEQIKWFIPPGIEPLPGQTMEDLRRQTETRDVRAFLSYDETTREAIVTIKGLIQPFEERVRIDQ